jgi:signal transduction histidine kinase/DNA-binding response OmpR family regulator
MFSCIKHHTDFILPNRFIATAYLEDDSELPEEWALMAKGVWEQLGAKIGQKGFKVNTTISKKKIIFDVSWKKENILFKIKTGFKWIFNIKKALSEITESRDAILSQYQKLEMSQMKLQKQTIQLKTAHEISTSIRQTPNIDDTLKAITKALVKEADFSAAIISIQNDLDDSDINVEFRSGEIIESIKSMHRKLIIDEKVIGKIEVHPNPEKDIREIDELLDYIVPVINIVIHDALALREVTNFKNNLEKMIADRTFELQKARDELSDTNKLLKEAQQAQSHFFTNISHEFRTPLTLIAGPAKQLFEMLNEEKTKAKADLIHRSAKKLNRLVDELLDISRIEAGEMKLKACKVNVVKIIKQISLSFYSLAERKNISFKIKSNNKNITAYLDKDKFDKILTNVLSNAFKFTPEGGIVEVNIKSEVQSVPSSVKGKLKEDLIEISIRDTGIGIPKNQIDKIFDRFYQVDGSHTREQEGTGIGLALTKELVDLHSGMIDVESEEGKGTLFKLYFPLGKDHLKPGQICDEDKIPDKMIDEPEVYDEKNLTIKDTQYLENETNGKPSLLIVEDNPDVRTYVKMILEDQYKIYESKDGEEGLNKSFEIIPDLIISDIMMPKFDGFMLVEKLKTDQRTSHIPVIMLTAKATIKDKVNGLLTGADDYIMKPFEAEELKARIINLLDQRKRLHNHFREYGLLDVENKNITSPDQLFMRNAIELISKHISDTEFDIEILSEKLNVSRSLLFKKVNALVGEPPGELIKRIRLNKAAALIERKFGNISEVALEVGFNNPSYFAEYFKKHFGVSPSQFHNKTSNS